MIAIQNDRIQFVLVNQNNIKFYANKCGLNSIAIGLKYSVIIDIFLSEQATILVSQLPFYCCYDLEKITINSCLLEPVTLIPITSI
jgi:hypothetical protein